VIVHLQTSDPSRGVLLSKLATLHFETDFTNWLWCHWACPGWRSEGGQSKKYVHCFWSPLVSREVVNGTTAAVFW